MSILIQGMKMPTEGYRQVFITADGEAIFFPSTPQNGELRFKVIPVPPHGDLIDRNALIDDMANMIPWAIESPEEIAMVYGLSEGYEAVKAAPTIIPADKEETE